MQPNHKAQAGTFESSDMMVLIEPLEHDAPNIIELSSNVSKQFGRQILEIVDEKLSEYQITGARIILKDKGALTPTIAARLETAIKRSLDLQEGTLYNN